MTDTTIIGTGINPAELEIPVSPEVSDRRHAFAGELDRARAEAATARERVRELEETVAARDREIQALRVEPITSGTDPRLSYIWERGGEIADERSFCEEYDAIVEALGGIPRSRDHDVTFRVTITQRVTVTASGTSEEDAEAAAEEDFDIHDVIRDLQHNGADHYEIEVIETERL